MSENRTGEVISSFLLGAVAGAVIGFLFAPAAGKETREKVSDWMEGAKDKTKEKLEKLEEEIKHRKDQLLKSHN